MPTAANLPALFAQANFAVPDPGSGVALPSTHGRATIGLVLGASAETNTLANPFKAGQELTLSVRTAGGGTRTVTFATAIDVAGGVTTLALTSARDWVKLESIAVGTAFRWQVVKKDLAASVDPDDALQDVTAGTAAANKALVAGSTTNLGGLLWLAVGAALPTNPQARFALLPPANASGVTANQSYFHGQILPGGATVIPTGTAPVVASLNIHEPNITATGTVTAAATVRIVDAPTEGSANYALWVDAGVTRLDGGLNVADAAWTITAKANTAAAVAISDGTTSLVVHDTRNTVTVQTHLFDAPAAQTLPDGATSRFRNVSIADHTVTLAGTTQVTTVNQGAALWLGAPTYAQSGGAVTVDQVSTLHVSVPVAGSMVTITANRMISTGVADAYLSNTGTWTDTMCWARGKDGIVAADAGAIERLVKRLVPKAWTYKGNDFGRQRVGIVYDDLPDELRMLGDKHAVSAGLLSSFSLSAIKTLWDMVDGLRAEVAALKAA